MTKEDIIRMARKAEIEPDSYQGWLGIEELEHFAALVRADEREACLNCYSPDDTATDWADKIRARGETK